MSGTAFLSLAFRPMFLAAALGAFALPNLWVSFFTGSTPYFGGMVPVLDWHAYSMYAGFASALVIGFLLTASANWSGKPAKAGWPLLLLLIFWVIEQVVVLIPGLPFVVFMIAALPVPLLFFVLLSIQLKENPRNRQIFIPWAGLFVAAKFIFLVGLLNTNVELIAVAKTTFLGSLRILVVVITGRIIPFFMEKRLGSRPVVPSWIEQGSILTICIALPIDILMLGDTATLLAYIPALAMNTMRLYYFKPMASVKVPVLLILQLGYLWLVVHLLFKVLAVFAHQYEAAVLHAFTAGCLGVFAIGMMTRVALGHTGRFIQADKWIQFMYFCVMLGAVMRVVVPIYIPEWYVKSLHHSGGWWSLGFFVYLVRFFPILTKPRPDAK